MSGGSPEPFPTLRLARWAAHGLVAGAVAGAAVGAIEALLTWGDASHFLFTTASKLRFAIFCAAIYGSAGAALGACGALFGAALLRFTPLGAWLAAALGRHREARAHEPRDALRWLALVLAGLPILAASLALTYASAYEYLALRRHPGLVIAVAMASTVLALAAAALATVIALRPAELALRALARPAAVARALSSPLAPPLAALLLVGGAAGVAAYLTWDTLSLLPTRTAFAGLAICGLIVLAGALCRPLTRRLLGLRPAVRRGALVALPCLLVAVTLTAGGSAGARKTANHYTGLGDPLMRAYRHAFDFDRNGFSPILGGGDCHPFNPHINPGAREIPDDSIDQNCVGGDARSSFVHHDPQFAPVPGSVPDRPNVVLITIDTLRHDHLGAYGYHRDTSPNLDRLAAEGTLFLNSWAHAPSTRYSMPAIMTGRYPLHVAYDNSVRGWPGLSEENTTIAEIAKARGYRTGGFFNHWYFDRVRRMDQGFDVYDNSNARLHQNVPGAGPAETTGSSSRQQTDAAIGFVDTHLAREGDEPFFLWVHYYDPHYVYQKRDGFDFGDEPRDLYDSEIAFTDHHIGRLFDHLRAQGLWNETAVVIASDHGEGFGEKGITLHGYHLYAPQTRVPLIMRIPGTWPRRVAMPVAHVDILPTLANVLGAEPTREMMGRSLVDVITGQHPPDEDRWIFQQLSFENNNEMRGAANQHCHVIYNISPHTSWELYRIDIDPEQTRDVIDRPGPCKEAPAVLAHWYNHSKIPLDAAEALLEARPEIAAPLDVHFGPEVTLLAVDLPAEPVRRGQRIDVTYTFEAGGALSDAWKIFVHLTSNAGGYFQGDHEPARPFSWWREGQHLRYTRSIQVPRDTPPGEYEVWMGLFRGNQRRPAHSERVPVADNRARVGTLTVR
jgi:choline-sulfatase